MAPASSVNATAMLGRGGVVVFDKHLIVGGRMTFARWKADRWQGNVSVPAVFVPAKRSLAPVVYSPAAARKLGAETGPGALLLAFKRPPTREEQERASVALSAQELFDRGPVTTDSGPYSSLMIGREYESSYRPGLLALIAAAAVILLTAAAISTGLAQADARPDPDARRRRRRARSAQAPGGGSSAVLDRHGCDSRSVRGSAAGARLHRSGPVAAGGGSSR